MPARWLPLAQLDLSGVQKSQLFLPCSIPAELASGVSLSVLQGGLVVYFLEMNYLPTDSLIFVAIVDDWTFLI